MSRLTLTAVAVDKLKPKPNRYEVADSGQRGLKLVIFPSGQKSFVVRYRFGGVKRKLRLAILVWQRRARRLRRRFTTYTRAAIRPPQKNKQKTLLRPSTPKPFSGCVSNTSSAKVTSCAVPATACGLSNAWSIP